MTASEPPCPDEHEADLTMLLTAANENNILLELAEQLGHIGHWQVSLPDYTVTWSREIYNIHGVSPDRYTPDIRSAVDFYHPDDRSAVNAAITAAAEAGTHFEFSLRLIRGDGQLRYVKSRGLTITGPGTTAMLIFGVSLDVTEHHRTAELLRQTNLRLEQIAYVDALTGLANRRQFDGMLEREWRRAIREQTSLSLIMLDIDRFKAFNDLYGHVAGDACLRAVAGAMTPIAQRPGDLFARYGGEEFAVILPVTEAAGAEQIARSVLAAIARLNLPHSGNASCGGIVTASLGVTTAYPQPGPPDAWLGLVAEADALLYEAKRTGWNRVVSPISIACDHAAPLPPNEAARLATLTAYDAAGATRRSDELDRIARLAATLISAPIGLVSLVGRDEQRFAGNFGLGSMEGTARDIAFCAHTILGEEPLIVADAARDSRFAGNPMVTGDLGLRYYAGAPIVCETTGHHLGAVCVIDRSGRPETSPAERALLTDLAKMAARLIADRAKLFK